MSLIHIHKQKLYYWQISFISGYLEWCIMEIIRFIGIRTFFK